MNKLKPLTMQIGNDHETSTLLSNNNNNDQIQSKEQRRPDYGATEGEEYNIPIASDNSEEEGTWSYDASSSPVSSTGEVSTQTIDSESIVAYLFQQQAKAMSALVDALFMLLGFESNPIRPMTNTKAATLVSPGDDDDDGIRNRNAATSMSSSRITSAPAPRRNDAAADFRLSILSNFSTAYNVLSISLALHIMEKLYRATPRDTSLCSSALIAGMIAGQLMGGTIGDVLGRHYAMALVMSLQVLAAFCSALSMPVHVPLLPPTILLRFSVFEVLAFWRFVLGLGCGGVYPLAATLTAESQQGQSGPDRAKAVALTFSFQGVGYLAVPAMAWWVVSIMGEQSDYAWRLLLGAGCIPGAVLTMLRVSHGRSSSNGGSSSNSSGGYGSSHNRRRSNSSSYHTRPSRYAKKLPVPEHHLEYTSLINEEEEEGGYLGDVEEPRHPSTTGQPVRGSVLDALRLEKDLLCKYLGTGGCWLLFDVLFYGNTLFQPVVLSAAFGAAETVQKAAQDTLIIACIAFPGYVASVMAVGRQSPRFIQMQGFFAMGILYLCIGVLFHVLAANRIALLLVYGLTFFFSNYGPNTTTFMLPSLTYTRACRSTMNGLSAASGKAGALIGATVFVMASSTYGQTSVFLVCALLSFAGCLLTWCCVPSRAGLVDPDEVIMNVNNMTHSERQVHEERQSLVRMKVVYSEPSLIDFVSKG